MKNLNEVAGSDFFSFLDSFDTVICDINGVLWNATPIPKVKETLAILKSLGKKVHYISNNSAQSTEEYLRNFQSIGVQLESNDLIHPALTLIDYVKSIKLNKKIFCIASCYLQNNLKDAGIDFIADDSRLVEDLKIAMKQTADDKDVGAVFVDFDVNISYLKITKAIAILRRPEVLYIAGALDRAIPITSNFSAVGSGTFTDIITKFSGRQPIVLGKPSEHLKKFAFQRFNITKPERVLFVGDMLEQDMAFATMCGFKKLLVMTGISTLNDAQTTDKEEYRPDYYIQSLGDLSEMIEIAESQKQYCQL